ALELGNGLDAGPGHDLVVSVRVVGGHDDDALGAAGAGHQGVAVGHQIRVELAGREGFHRSRVVEPLELDVDPGLFEPALVDGDLPSDPPRPVAVTDGERLGRRGRLRDKAASVAARAKSEYLISVRRIKVSRYYERRKA